MDKARHVDAPRLCTGCSLCANLCPRDAIRITRNPDGFLVPEVDTRHCVECGLCQRKCPALAAKSLHPGYSGERGKFYGAWHADASVRHGSSSGGVFSALAEQILKEGGCVFGVIWESPTEAVYAKAENEKELQPMRGSKYVQAKPGYVYRQVRNELGKGRKVLFSGTPCQVHALKTFLGQDNDLLLTLDVICHGVPSHHLITLYVDEWEQKMKKAISCIGFREKEQSWLCYNVNRHYTDGTEQRSTLHEDDYMQAFLSDKALNTCCYQCRYAHIPGQGDITLGDYWGVEKKFPDWDWGDGVSAVYAHTRKGMAAIEQARGALNIKEEHNLDAGKMTGGLFSRKTPRMDRGRRKVLNRLRAGQFAQAVDMAKNDRYIGPFRIDKRGYLLHAALRVGKYLSRMLRSRPRNGFFS